MASQALARPRPRRFFLKTLGCTKNVVDSERVEALLCEQGLEPVPHPGDSDVIIVNTCAFIGPAKQESIDTILELAQGKRRGQRLLALGCMAERYGRELLRELPELDGALGVHQIDRVGEVLQRAWAGQRPCYQGGAAEAPRALPQRRRALPSMYLKIADGCDAACAFCAIPGIRGPQRSRPGAEIVEEAVALAEQGAREIILIAQDTPAWGRDLRPRERLADLLPRLGAALPRQVWLRTLYLNPWFVTRELLEAMAATPQFQRYLDIPLQHTHPAVLKRMRRGYDLERIHALLEQARAILPGVAIRSQFIVGFPGETEEEFQHLLRSLRELRLDRVGFFQYSREEGTPGADLTGQVSARAKRERYHAAMATQQAISHEINQGFVGSELEILVEGAHPGRDGLTLVGRSYRDAPEIDGVVLAKTAAGKAPHLLTIQPASLPAFQRVRITRASPYDLMGTMC